MIATKTAQQLQERLGYAGCSDVQIRNPFPVLIAATPHVLLLSATRRVSFFAHESDSSFLSLRPGHKLSLLEDMLASDTVPLDGRHVSRKIASNRHVAAFLFLAKHYILGQGRGPEPARGTHKPCRLISRSCIGLGVDTPFSSSK